MLSGDNGLLTKTVESKEETRGGAIQEQRDLWKLEQTSDQYAKTQSTKSLAALLRELGPNGQKLLTANEIDTINETGQVKIGSRTIVFDEILTIGSEYDKGNIKIGDSITFTANNGHTDWIVFGKDKSGNVLIATKEPVGMFNITFDAQHWVSWVDDLNNACSGYSGTVQGNTVTARSMNLEDVNRAVGYTEPEFVTFRFGTVYDQSNGKLNYYYPSDNIGSGSASYFKKATVDTLTVPEGSSDVPAKDFKIGDYSYYKTGDKYYGNVYSPTGNESGYIDLNNNLKNAENFKYVVGDSSQFDPFYLADKTCNISNDGAKFGGAIVAWNAVYSLFNSICTTNALGGQSGSYWVNAAKLRPVVPLPSNIKVQEENGIYDIKE